MTNPTILRNVAEWNFAQGEIHKANTYHKNPLIAEHAKRALDRVMTQGLACERAANIMEEQCASQN